VKVIIARSQFDQQHSPNKEMSDSKSSSSSSSSSSESSKPNGSSKDMDGSQADASDDKGAPEKKGSGNKRGKREKPKTKRVVADQLPPSGISKIFKEADVDRAYNSAKTATRNILMWTTNTMGKAVQAHANKCKRQAPIWDDFPYACRHFFPAVAEEVIYENPKFVEPDPNKETGRKKGGRRGGASSHHYEEEIIYTSERPSSSSSSGRRRSSGHARSSNHK
jgi:hypothetical protein